MNDLEGSVEVSASVEVPEVVHAGDTVQVQQQANPGFNGEWGNVEQELASIKAELGQQAPQPEPVQPVQPQATQAPPTEEPVKEEPKPEVPKKFLTADGQVDVDRLNKSYISAEKELKRLQNQVKKAPYQAPQQAPQSQPAPAGEITFEQQVEQDVQKFGLGPTLTRLFNSAGEMGYAKAMEEVRGLKEMQEERDRHQELARLTQLDPFVGTQKGFDTLKGILTEKPWLLERANPWTEAHKEYIYTKQSSGSQVHTPTPRAPTAPPAPVVAASRSIPDSPPLSDRAALEAHLNKMTPQQEKEFWAKQGIVWRR